MSEIDYIISEPGIKIIQDAVFNMRELYSYLKRWFDEHEYYFFEKEYINRETDEGKLHKIVWVGIKKLDDYVKIHVEVKINATGMKDVEVKGGMVSKGKVQLRFMCFLEKDYEDSFETSFITKFSRGLYDKFVAKSRITAYEREAKDDTYDIFNDTKSFLHLHKLE